jgi:hypothetical protein
MAKDKFAGFSPTPALPATSLADIEPDDGADLGQITIALNVATAGTVRVTAADGSAGTVFVTPGAAFPIRVRRIWATGTTATGIVGLF